ncbi:MAG: nickel-dependent hydrogenase large subunit [Sulfurovaceae bacterium]|nr:nickel-dependent hydrogenase large subunit [Sulfurovaceae bacterium]
MKIKQLIEKIEGEAELEFDFQNGLVNDVNIIFPLYRGIEDILRDREARDALVIAPRVCGICNHAHLIAGVRAIEDGLKKAGININLTSKAISLREFTLSCEIIQSHIKWIYLVALPQLSILNRIKPLDSYLAKASWSSNTVVKAMSIFSGQWPHNSYAIPGGVSCDPTYEEIIHAETLLDETIRFMEQEFLGINIEAYMKNQELSESKGDIATIWNLINKQNIQSKGKSHNRFIAFGEHEIFKAGEYSQNRTNEIDTSLVKEHEQPNSKAKSVTYNSLCYEVGPLARAMLAKNNRIMSLYNIHKDSNLIRIYARIDEMINLLLYAKKLLANLHPKELSCTLSKFPKGFSTKGIGAVEAARGSLIHETVIRDGKIENYTIITPTQWNLSPGTSKESGIAIEAMKGSSSAEEASFVFRIFDICSACTTH